MQANLCRLGKLDDRRLIQRDRLAVKTSEHSGPFFLAIHRSVKGNIYLLALLTLVITRLAQHAVDAWG